MSVSQGNVGAYPSFWPLAASAEERRRFGLSPGTMAVKPWFGPDPTGPAWGAGLRGEHMITAVDGDRPDLVARAFLVWFRRARDPGDRVELTVRNRNGAETRIAYQLPGRQED